MHEKFLEVYLAASSVVNSSYKEYTKYNLKIYQIYAKLISIAKTYNLMLFVNAFLLFHVDDQKFRWVVPL